VTADALPVATAPAAGRRALALIVLVGAVVVGAWQAGRIVGPLDTGAPLPAHVDVHGSVISR
jgi:hypothetical protein